MTALALFYGHFELWQLYHKVTFDGANKIIIINDGETFIDVEEDLYSAWKEWVLVDDNVKFLAAMRGVGGDPTVGGDFLGATFFLINGWKIRPFEGDHSLTVRGNLFSEDGLDPFIPTLGEHTILVTRQVSNLIDKITGSATLTIEQAEQLVKIEQVYKDSKLHTALLLDKA